MKIFLVQASVSVCSDVPGFTEPRCFISEGEPKDMIDARLHG